MKYLKISNTGLLDIRLVALMGGTTKANDKFKIGRFGTGLKYTLAYLYRNNIGFKCFVGNEEVRISTEIEEIGDTIFEIICINGQRTSITTQMGSDWTAWMIIRELWCNALDEGGHSKSVVFDDNVGPSNENETCFFIQITPAIQDIIDNWGDYFIMDRTPIFENDLYAIYPNDGDLRVYKHGVLIFHQPDKESVFKYDIKAATINELREYKGLLSMDIESALSNPNTETINHFFSHIKEDHYEAVDMSFDWYSTFGNVWRDAIGSQQIVSWDTVKDIEKYGITPEQIETAIALPKKLFDKLTNAFEGVGVLRKVNKHDFYEFTDPALETKTEEVMGLLNGCGYHIHEDLNLVYGISANKDIKVMISRNKRELLISKSCLILEDIEFASCIVEQNELYVSNLGEDTIAFRHHLARVATNLILQNVPEIKL